MQQRADLALPEGEALPISRLAWEMNQFEVHYLRNMVQSMLVYAQLAQRNRWGARHVVASHLQARARYQQAMQRALRDQAYRNGYRG